MGEVFLIFENFLDLARSEKKRKTFGVLNVASSLVMHGSWLRYMRD